MQDLDSIVAAIYESVSFENGRRPDWNRQATIFAGRTGA